jgi:hypothetical protein
MVCFISLSVCAGNDEELFLRGNKLYESRDYPKALESYAMMTHKGRAVMYNMGNCYYHTNDYPQALVYWTRAERGATPQEVALIEQNKQQLLQKMGKSEKHSYGDRLVRFLYSMIPFISLLSLQFVFLMCWYLFVICAYKNGRYKKLFLSICVLCVMLTGTLLWVYSKKHNNVYGVVKSQQVSIFSGPDKGFHSVGSVGLAEYVDVKEKREGWYKIGYSGTIGWVEAEAIQII